MYLDKSQNSAYQHQTVQSAVRGQVDDSLAVRRPEVEHQNGNEPTGQNDDASEETTVRFG